MSIVRNEGHMSAAQPGQPVLRARGLTKSFAGVTVLSKVDIDVMPGQVVAIVGENGAGKSTLKNLLTGLLTPDSGTIEIAGRQVTRFRAADYGIAAVHQEFSLFASLSVAENICITALPGSPSRVNWAETRRIAQQYLDIIGADIDPNTTVETLSTGKQQLVEIAKAVRQANRMLILDEPTASLTEPERELLFAVIERLRERALGMIFISHFIEEVYRVADQIVVLRDGEHVGGGLASELPRARLEELMVGRPIVEPKMSADPPQPEVAMRVARLSCAPQVSDVNFELHRGEILGLSGLMGAGRTELVEAIYGLRPSQGEVWVGNALVERRTPATMKNLGVAFVPEDRRRHGLFNVRPLRENLTAAALERCVERHIPGVGFNGETRNAQRISEELRIIHPGLDQSVRLLSGGNQQKSLLGRWLAIQPRICIFDEPTRGVDIGAKEEIHKLIVNLARQGMAVLLVSSDLPEIMRLAHRILVLHKGRVVKELHAADFDPRTIIQYASMAASAEERR
jgi:ABC-type sugar transport system ATPase subunit